MEEGFPVNTEEPVCPTPVEYITSYREELVKKIDDIVEALQSGSVQVVDARNEQRYSGTGTEPRPGLPSGHMIGSVNLPYFRLFNPETKTLASKKVIQEGKTGMSHSIFCPFCLAMASLDRVSSVCITTPFGDWEFLKPQIHPHVH